MARTEGCGVAKRASRRIDGDLTRQVIRLADKGATYREILSEVDSSRGQLPSSYASGAG